MSDQIDTTALDFEGPEPTDGAFRLGRTAPPRGLQMLYLKDYLNLDAIGEPPPLVDYSQAASISLGKIYKNNQLGCCVISGFLHVLGLMTANSGTEFLATDDMVVKDYSAVGGYVPGRPNTDRGCNEIDAVNYYMNHGFPDGSKALGYLKINTQDLRTMRIAVWLFEHIIYGAGLPNSWLNPRGNGFVWDVARNNPANGHCFITPGKYDQGGFGCGTWGLIGTLTNAAVQKCISEAYVLLHPALVSKINNKAPSGMEWASLVDDWNSLGGNVPKPPPMNFSWDV